MATLAAASRRVLTARTGLHGAPWLMAGHAAIVGSGLVFWLVAGRMASRAEVGAAAGAIAAAMLATSLGQLGLPQAVLRHSHGHGDPGALAGSALTAVWGSCALAGLSAALVLTRIPAAGNAFAGSPALPVGLALGAAGVAQIALVWHVASAAGRPRVALATSATEAVLKVSLVGALARFGAGGLVMAWALSTAGAAALGAWGLLPRTTGRALRPRIPRPAVLGPVLRFSLASHVGDLVLFTPTMGILGWLIPLIVVARHGAEAGAIFYVAWAMAAGLQAVPFALSTTNVADGAARGLGHGEAERAALWLGLPGIPLALAAALGAPLVLSIFGGAYADDGSSLLQTLAPGTVAAGFNVAFSTALKVEGDTAALHALGVAAIVPVVLAAELLPVERGLEAVALAWLLAQVGGLVGALSVHYLPRRAPAAGPPALTAVVRASTADRREAG